MKEMKIYQKWLTLDIFSLPSKCIEKKASLPKCSCIYFFIGDNQIIYIGCTTNLHKRINQHDKLEKNQRVLKISWIEVKDEEEGYMGESILISRFKPCLNIRIQNEFSLRPIRKWLPYVLIANENDFDEEVINQRKKKNKRINKHFLLKHNTSSLSKGEEILLYHVEELGFSFSYIASKLSVSSQSISNIYTRIGKKLIKIQQEQECQSKLI